MSCAYRQNCNAVGAYASGAEARTGADATGAEARTGADATGAEVRTGADAAAELFLGSPSIFRVTDGHSFSRPLLNLTSHLFSPLASNIVP
jgi:hypothetical protein